MPPEEKGWKYATKRQVENLEKELKTEIELIKAESAHHGIGGVIAQLKRIADALEKGSSGGLTPEQIAQLKAVGEKLDANDAAVAEALKTKIDQPS